MVKEKVKTGRKRGPKIPGSHDLFLFNDNFNTFEFVIDTLVEVCGHDSIQAEQCALVAHFKGKCVVKSGTLEELKPIHDEMTHRDLTVSII